MLAAWPAATPSFWQKISATAARSLRKPPKNDSQWQCRMPAPPRATTSGGLASRREDVVVQLDTGSAEAGGARPRQQAVARDLPARHESHKRLLL